MLYCLLVGIDLPAIVSRVDEEFDGTSEIPAALEVHGKLRREPRRLIAVKADHQITGLAVQEDPAFVHQILIEVVLIEHVRKPIAAW